MSPLNLANPPTSQETNQPEVSDINTQSLFLEDEGMVYNFPKNMTTGEIDYHVWTGIKGNSEEDYFTNREPMSGLMQGFKDSVDLYLKHGQEAMKLLATAPDVALGMSKDISPEELSKVYKPWYDLWIESPIGKKLAISEQNPEFVAKHPGLSFVPWFLAEYIPAETVNFFTHPSMIIGGKVFEGAAAKFGPPIINKLYQKFPTLAKKLPDFFKAEADLSAEFEALGVNPNAKTSDVVKAYRNKILANHPDRGGNVDEAIKINEAFSKIRSSRNNVMDKIIDFFRQSEFSKPKPAPKLSLSSESGQADLIPNFEPGDLARMGKKVVKVVKLSGEMATINQAGKMVEVPIKKLKPHNPLVPAEEQKGVPEFKSTEEAWDYALKNKDNPEIVKQLQEKYKVASKSSGDYLQKIDSGEDLSNEDFDKSMQLATQKQFLRESLQKIDKFVPEQETKPAVNKKRLDLTATGQKNIDEATQILADKIEALTGTPITHEEVLQKAKLSEGYKKGVSRETSLETMGRLLKTRQEMTKLANEPKITSEFLKSMRAVKEIGADTARALESMKITASGDFVPLKQQVIQELMKNGKTDEEILAMTEGVDFNDYQQVKDFWKKYDPSTPLEKLTTQLDQFAYMNMLSSPMTLGVNALSSIINLSTVNPAILGLSSVIDTVPIALYGKERENYIQAVPAYYKAALNAFPEALSKGWDIMLGKSMIQRPDVRRIQEPDTWVKVATLGVGPYILRFMEATDQILRTMIAAGEREALYTNYLKQGKGEISPSDKAKIEELADRRAMEAVYRTPLDPNNETKQGYLLSRIDALTALVYKLREVLPFHVGHLFLRFIQTPMQMLKTGVFEQSPLGAFSIKDNADEIRQTAKVAYGSLLFLAGLGMGLKGRSTWGLPKNKSDRELFYQAGRQPYSFNIGSEENPLWITYSRLGHVAYPIAMGAALNYHMNESPTALSDTTMQKTFNSLTGMMAFFSDQSYVRSLGDLIKTGQGDEQSLKNFLSSFPEQYIPLAGLQGWVNYLIDPLYRKVEKDASVESISQNLSKKLIGMSQNLPPAMDMFGQPQENKERVFNSFSPLRIKQGDPEMEKFYKEMQGNKQLMNKFQKMRDEQEEKILKELLREQQKKGVEK